jgi:hypothetical protein
VSSLRHRGDFLVVEIAAESVIIVRGEDGELRAFANVCRQNALMALGMSSRRSAPSKSRASPYCSSSIADHAYVLESGRIVLTGRGPEWTTRRSSAPTSAEAGAR